MEDIVRRLDFLRGNTPDVSPDNTREQNSRIIARKNQERFQNSELRKEKKNFQTFQKELLIS